MGKKEGSETICFMDPQATIGIVSSEDALAHLQQLIGKPVKPVGPEIPVAIEPPPSVRPDLEAVRRMVENILVGTVPRDAFFFGTVASAILVEVKRSRTKSKDEQRWTVQVATQSGGFRSCVPLERDPHGMVVRLSGSATIGSMSDSVTRFPWGRIVAIKTNSLFDVRAWDAMPFKPVRPTERMRISEYALRIDIGSIARTAGVVLTLHLKNGKVITGEVVRNNDFGCLVTDTEIALQGTQDLYFVPWSNIDFFDLHVDVAKRLGLLKNEHED